MLALTGNSNNGTIELSTPICGTYELLEFAMSNRIHTINANNNKVYVRINDTTDYTLTLTTQSYTGTQLATELQTQLNTIAGSTFSVSYNSQTGKLSVSETSGDTFGWRFGTYTTDTAQKVLGFEDADTAASTSYTAENPIDLNSVKVLFFAVNQATKNIEGLNYFSSNLVISGLGSFGEMIRYKREQNYFQRLHFHTATKKLTFRFHDQNNANVAINTDWLMVLRKI